MIKLVNSVMADDLLNEMRDIRTEEYKTHRRWNNRFYMVSLELAMLMLHAAEAELPTVEVEVSTPVAGARHLCRRIDQPKLAFVSVLRAGEEVAAAARKRCPDAKFHWIKIYRDEVTSVPVVEGHNLPHSFAGMTVIVMDPMLATGGTMVAAVNMVKLRLPAHAAAICFVGCPVGKSLVEVHHPEVPVYLTALDPLLTDRYYISPGLGDAGDRAFGPECEEGLRVVMAPYGQEYVQIMLALFHVKQERLARKAKPPAATVTSHASGADQYIEGTDKI